MSEQKGLLTRLLVRLTPQFLEDWKGAAGRRFRETAQRLSDYNSDHAQVGEKVDQAPGMLWKAAEGATSAQHAKAEADYAKAENDRIEAELKRKTLAAKTRHECADADRAESEARLSQLAELKARIELVKQLSDIGVALSIDTEKVISFLPALRAVKLEPTRIISDEDLAAVDEAIIPVIFHGHDMPGHLPAYRDFSIGEWYCSLGERVERGRPLYEVSGTVDHSPISRTRFQIMSPASGLVIRIFAEPNASITVGQMVGMILQDS